MHTREITAGNLIDVVKKPGIVLIDWWEGGLAAAFRIRSIPTLMVFRDGVLLFAEAGMLPAASEPSEPAHR